MCVCINVLKCISRKTYRNHIYFLFSVNCTCTDDDGDDENNSCFSIPCDDEDDEVCGTAGCIPFRRSRPTIPGDCAPGSRTHENTITSFVDASNVYGSFPEDAEALLDKEEGIYVLSAVAGNLSYQSLNMAFLLKEFTSGGGMG